MLEYLSFYNKIKSFDITYHSPLIQKVTNLLESTDLNIAFRTCNIIYKQLCDKAPQNKLSLVEYTNYNTKHETNHMLARLDINRNKTPWTYIKTSNPISA